MTHSIEPTSDGLRIRAKAPQDKQHRLLEEFARCAAGTCSCPSPQFEKLRAIEVDAEPDGVTVDLKVKPGEHIDVAGIENCLAHTLRRAGV